MSLQEDDNKMDKFITLWKDRPADVHAGMTADETYMLYSSALYNSKLQGAMAEVGVYKGWSAKIICEAKGDKPLFLFDTFEGFPLELIQLDKDNWNPTYRTHSNTSVEFVQNYLKNYNNVSIIKGVFPDSLKTMSNIPETFCFVNLDTDIYQSTLDCLKFFYPRMVTGGRIISHNYGNLTGVNRAFNEFIDKNRIIQLADTQCLVIK